VQCAAGLAVLDVIGDEELLAGVRGIGDACAAPSAAASSVRGRPHAFELVPTTGPAPPSWCAPCA
jgi:hypothetical protein